MEDFVDIVLKMLAVLLGAGVGYFGKIVVSWIKCKLEAQQNAKLDELVTTFVAAAEQMYKDGDKTGTARYEYVSDMLEEMGYIISNELNALIESKVFEINLYNNTEDAK